MNNWLLSVERAEATRASLVSAGIDTGRFARIEGVAAGEPFNPINPLDPSNRRISVTLLESGGLVDETALWKQMSSWLKKMIDDKVIPG